MVDRSVVPAVRKAMEQIAAVQQVIEIKSQQRVYEVLDGFYTADIKTAFLQAGGEKKLLVFCLVPKCCPLSGDMRPMDAWLTLKKRQLEQKNVAFVPIPILLWDDLKSEAERVAFLVHATEEAIL